MVYFTALFIFLTLSFMHICAYNISNHTEIVSDHSREKSKKDIIENFDAQILSTNLLFMILFF